MSATSDFYLARAEQSATDAAATNLVNVRERCLRAEEAWRTMADRLIRGEEDRTRAAAVKAMQLGDPA